VKTAGGGGGNQAVVFLFGAGGRHENISQQSVNLSKRNVTRPALNEILRSEYQFILLTRPILRGNSVADPHQSDAEPDPSDHSDANPDPACHFDANPHSYPTFHFDADPDPSFQIKAQNL
jgi:hypothetical protein